MELSASYATAVVVTPAGWARAASAHSAKATPGLTALATA